MQLPGIVLDAWKRQKGWATFVSYKDPDQDWKDIPLSRLDADKVFRGKGFAPPRSDLYFCFNSFSKGRRMEKFFEPSPFLYADLDEVDPYELDIRPTIAWQTSEDKYQCAWQLDKRLPLDAHKRLNKGLTYLTGADKGGWSVTKVLRIPGTYNHKYGRPQKVILLWRDGPTYTPKDILSVIRDVTMPQSVESLTDLGLPDVTSDAVMRARRDVITERAHELLSASEATVGERSDRLWELECLLLSAGIPSGEVVVLVRDTVWNKYGGQARELAQLWKEVQKAEQHIDGQKDPDASYRTPSVGRTLRFEAVDQFMGRSLPTERWMIEGIWSHDGHGLIAGEAKTYKSFIATELAIAVASGAPFLGRFEIPQRGPAWIIQEENTPAMMQDRLHKITLARGCGGEVNGSGLHLPESLPLKLMNNQGFDLRNENHMGFLEDQLTRAKSQGELPKLLVLDPFYLLAPGLNESDATDISPLLRRLLHLKQKWSVGILIVHHYNKPREGEDRHPGNRIAGSNVFYRWFQDALYLSKGKEPGQVTMIPEHRGHAPTGAINIEFDIGEMGEDEYFVEVDIRRSETSGLRKGLKLLIEANPRGLKLPVAAENLGISKQRVITLSKNLGYQIVEGERDGSLGRPAQVIVSSPSNS